MTLQTAETKLTNPQLNKEEAYELTASLNTLLADYSVVYQKLRNFHWNVVGGDFYDVHEKLEEEYLAGAEHIDEIAERVRMLGFKPLSTMADFLEQAGIAETDKDHSAEEMIAAIVADYKQLITSMNTVVKQALKREDYGTDFMVRNMIIRTEQKIWMFQSFIK